MHYLGDKFNFITPTTMIKIIKRAFVLAAAFFMAPLAALAQYGGGFQNGLGGIQNLFPGSGIAGSTTLNGPNGLIYNVILDLLYVAGAIAVLFLIIGGFWYITSAGNEEQAEKGKSTLISAIIGIVIIVLSYVIVTVVSNFVLGSG